MRMRRGLFRLLLLATLGWVAFIAYTAWGTVPRAAMPVAMTQLQDYCRFSFRVTSDMSAAVVRYEAAAQYRHAKSNQDPRCRDYRQLTDAQVADIATQAYNHWLTDQRRIFASQHHAELTTWTFNYLLRAIVPPILVWLVIVALTWLGGSNRGEA